MRTIAAPSWATWMGIPPFAIAQSGGMSTPDLRADISCSSDLASGATTPSQRARTLPR
jgi:hypothetical protein